MDTRKTRMIDRSWATKVCIFINRGTKIGFFHLMRVQNEKNKWEALM